MTFRNWFPSRTGRRMHYGTGIDSSLCGAFTLHQDRTPIPYDKCAKCARLLAGGGPRRRAK